MTVPEISDERLVEARIPLRLPCETCMGTRYLPNTKQVCGKCAGSGEIQISVFITDLHRLIDRAHQVEWDRRIRQSQKEARATSV